MHLPSLDWKTLSKDTAIHDKIKNLLTINPTELLELERDRSLLDTDFDAPLETGPTEHCLIWTASINTALTAAQHPRANNIDYNPPD